MITIQLKAHKEESLLRFHPWVFSGAIQRVFLDEDYPYNEPQEGEMVQVLAADNRPLGIGHFQKGSIAVRMLHFGEGELPSNFWQERLRSAYALRKQLSLISSDNNTYRLVHGEGDSLPGLVVDVYGDTAVMQAHSIGMHRARQQVAETLVKEVKEVKNVYYKSDDTLPLKAEVEGNRVGYLVGENSPDEYWAKENTLQFRIDWLKGQKTGFFIDQRDNRQLLSRYARDKRVLNMFCYTGGFSVYALRGGASEVHSVDVSEKAVEMVNENITRNFSMNTNHKAYAADAFDFLRSTEKFVGKPTRYDLIILDPPAFAKHRDAIHNALRGYQRINAAAIEKIERGGILFTFSCSQAIDKDHFRQAVFSAAAEVRRKVRILHQLHQPADHPINIYHPEGEYLKGLVLEVE